MIIVCGIPSEPPVSMVIGALEELGFTYFLLNQRSFAESSIDFSIIHGAAEGQLTVKGHCFSCADVSGVYSRLMDWRLLPEVTSAKGVTTLHCRAWHEAIMGWIEFTPARVMNRTAAMATNESKPYQAQLIRQVGFQVPETLVTNDPELVRDFRAKHGQLIYKSTSGVRSIVRMLDEDASQRLHLIRWCPVQFQQFIRGTNLRVHVVSGQLFVTRIETDCIDYRYAWQDGGYANLTPTKLTDELSERCVILAKNLGLELAGIDLIQTDEGQTYCLEVNPSPAFSFYELNSRQPIARAIATALAFR